MFILKIADETADQIMRDILRQDYIGLTRQISELKAKAAESPLPEYAREDLAFNERVIQAMDVMMEYYIGDHWRDTL